MALSASGKKRIIALTFFLAGCMLISAITIGIYYGVTQKPLPKVAEITQSTEQDLANLRTMPKDIQAFTNTNQNLYQLLKTFLDSQWSKVCALPNISEQNRFNFLNKKNGNDVAVQAFQALATSCTNYNKLAEFIKHCNQLAVFFNGIIIQNYNSLINYNGLNDLGNTLSILKQETMSSWMNGVNVLRDIQSGNKLKTNYGWLTFLNETGGLLA